MSFRIRRGIGTNHKEIVESIFDNLPSGFGHLMSNLQKNLKLDSFKQLPIVKRLKELIQDEVERDIGTLGKSQALLLKNDEDKAQGKWKGKKKDQDDKKDDGPKDTKGCYYFWQAKS